MTEELIEQNSCLIYSIAKKFYNVEKEDLYQAGVLGLIKAYNNYNSDVNCNFSSYAYKYIFGEMYELSMRCRNIKLNKECLRLYKMINNAKSLLTQKLNREATIEDISSYLNVDISEIEYVLYITQDMFSLDDECEFIQPSIKDSILDDLMLKDSFNNLDSLSSAVMNYRYSKDLTQSEVADKLGISQVKVSRIESSSKQKIREYISI